MKLCNDAITLFNAAYDPVTDADVYYGTVINGVSWYRTDAASVVQSGLKEADRVVVRIPVDADFGGKRYVSPIEYATAQDKSELFTLMDGDTIVHGAVPTTGRRPAELHKLESMTVLAVTDNRRALHAKHWKVTGG